MGYIEKLIENIIRKKRQEISFEKLDPVLDIKENYAVMTNGDVAFFFAIKCYEEESLTRDQFKDINKKLQVVLNTLAAADILQRLDIYYEIGQGNNEKGKNYANKFPYKIASHHEGREVIYDKNYLIIVFSSTAVRKTPTGTGFSNPKMKTNPLSGVKQRIAIGQERVKSLEGQLNEVFESAKTMRKEEIENLFYQIYNLDFTRKHNRIIKQHANEFSCYSVGEKKVNIVSLTERPQDYSYCVKNEYGTYSPFIYRFTNRLRCPHILSQTIRLKNTEKELKRLDNEVKRIETNRQADQLTANDIKEFTSICRTENQRIVDFSLQVIMFDINDKRREKSIIEVENSFRNMNGAVGITETAEDIGNLFFANIPGNMNNNYRWVTPLLASQALCCTNMVTSITGDEKGDYLCNRERRLVKVDFSSEDELNNQHAMIFGPSGSGKSVLMALLIGQRHARREKQIIIDSGGTYKNLVTLLKGEYHEYDPENPLRTNPFLIPKKEGKYNLTEDKINYLMDFIITEWKGEEKAKEIESAILRKWLFRYYDYVNGLNEKPSQTMFMVWLKDYNKRNSKDSEHRKDLDYLDFDEFSRIMEQYSTGIYEQAINSLEVDEIGNNDLVCFDLKNIKENKRLYPLVTKQIIEMSNDFTIRWEHIRKWLYLEEAWNSIEDKIGEKVATFCRTWRKHKGAVYTITQGMEEIEKSKIGFTLLDNSDVRFILNHRGKEPDEIQKLIKANGMTQLAVDKLNGLRREKDFRDVLIKRLGRFDVFAVEMPLYVYAATSSKERERNILRDMFEFYSNMEHAVEQFVEIKEFDL